MIINFRIDGFHNCDGCARKVRTTVRRIGVELVELDRESGNVAIETTESPEVIRHALERQLKKSVVVLSRDLVPANPNPVVSHQAPTNRALYLQEVGQVVLGLAEVLDAVEINRSNTTRISFIRREIPENPTVVRRENGGCIGVRIRDVDAHEYTTPRPPPRSPPWAPMEPTPSAPLMPMAEQVVTGYPPDYYGGSTSRSHDHPNGCCNIL